MNALSKNLRLLTFTAEKLMDDKDTIKPLNLKEYIKFKNTIEKKYEEDIEEISINKLVQEINSYDDLNKERYSNLIMRMESIENYIVKWESMGLDLITYESKFLKQTNIYKKPIFMFVMGNINILKEIKKDLIGIITPRNTFNSHTKQIILDICSHGKNIITNLNYDPSVIGEYIYNNGKYIIGLTSNMYNINKTNFKYMNKESNYDYGYILKKEKMVILSPNTPASNKNNKSLFAKTDNIINNIIIDTADKTIMTETNDYIKDLANKKTIVLSENPDITFNKILLK